MIEAHCNMPRPSSRRTNCASFRYPSPGDGQGWIERTSRKSAIRCWECESANGSRSLFTRIPGRTCNVRRAWPRTQWWTLSYLRGGLITAVASQRGQGRVRGHGARLQRKKDGSLGHPRGVPCSATGLESSYCNFGAAVQEKCENYEGCYLLALKTYEARVPETKIEEANRKVNWRVPQRIV